MATETYPWGNTSAHVAEKLREIESHNCNLFPINSKLGIDEARDKVSSELPDIKASHDGNYLVSDTHIDDGEHKWDAKMPGRLTKTQWRSSATVLGGLTSEPSLVRPHTNAASSEASLAETESDKILAEEAKSVLSRLKELGNKDVDLIKETDLEKLKASEQAHKTEDDHEKELVKEIEAENELRLKQSYDRSKTLPPADAVYFTKQRSTDDMLASSLQSIWQAVTNPPKRLGQLKFHRTTQKGDSRQKPTVWQYKDSTGQKYLVKPVPRFVPYGKSNEPASVAELQTNDFTYVVMLKPPKGSRVYEGIFEF